MVFQDEEEDSDMARTPEIILKTLAIAGALFANWAVSYIPMDWGLDTPTIVGALTALIINLGTVVFWSLISLLAKTGLKMDIITSVVLAAEEQFGPGTDSGDKKLEFALNKIQEEMKKNKLGFFASWGLRLFSKPLIKALAPRIKKIWYTVPEEPPSR